MRIDRSYVILVWEKFIYPFTLSSREREREEKKSGPSLDSLMDCACNVWKSIEHNALSSVPNYTKSHAERVFLFLRCLTEC